MSALAPLPAEMMPMSERDLGAVVAIENEAYEFPWTHGNFRDALKAGYSAWVCRIGGELAGYVIIMTAVDEAHLLNISVGGQFRRRGFGSRLLRHAMDTAIRNGALSLLLEVRPSNDAALELYRHFGFATIGVRRGYYPATSGREDAVVLRRELGQVTA